MPISYLHYGLHFGYVHNWLTAGPMALPVENPEGYTGSDLIRHILQTHTTPDSGITTRPVERASLEEGTFKIGNYQGAWSYYACKEDHWVDHSGHFPVLQYLCSWAYTQLVSKEPQKVSLVLNSFGKSDLWLNGAHLGQVWPENGRYSSKTFVADLRPGGNELLVRFETAAFGDCPHAVALQVCKPAKRNKPASYIAGSEIRVRLPTAIRSVKRRNFLERFFESAYLDRDIYGLDEQIFVRWPEEWKEPDDVNLRLIGPKGWIYGEAIIVVRESERVFLGYGHTPPPGASRIILLPKPDEVYKDQTRIQREMTVWTAGLASYSETSAGSYQERRNEALAHAVRQNQGLFSEIARMELGRWKLVEPANLKAAVEAVRQRQPDCAQRLLGLLGMVLRYGDRPEFPEGIKEQVEAAALNAAYRPLGLENDGESQRLTWAVCAVLAGQLYPQSVFTAEKVKGAQLHEQGECQALEWLKPHLAYGFADWHGQASGEQIFTALAHLVDFTQEEQVYEMASLLLDKMFLSLAVNSYKGIHGCAHHQAVVPAQRSALFNPLSGICRLMFGSGAYNFRVAGYVSLACLKNYEFPEILANIAQDAPDESLHRERHAFPGAPEANLVSYKTPDYLLASVQDYQPGEHGSAEHLWQATLGHSAIVYVHHPGSAGDSDALTPNFWLGNRVLPRLAQWKDVLIGLYQIPENDWMGFTHAYFPAYAFDEYALRGKWAFARKGEGYLALTASVDFEMKKRGLSAFRELRAAPGPAVWVCHMGRRALDGEFMEFQEKVLALPVNFDGLAVRLSTLRGEELTFGWLEPLRVNGLVQPLTGFKHMDSSYCQADLPCQQIEIRWQDELLRLNLEGLS